MIQTTRDYTQFEFIPENRYKIDRAHVEKLKESMQEKNLLDLRPVIVNPKYQIIDGQHRFIAAKELGLDIHYVVEKVDTQDLLRLNINKPMQGEDYLNFWRRQGLIDYQKMYELMQMEDIGVHTAFLIAQLVKTNTWDIFRKGEMIWPADRDLWPVVIICRDTIRTVGNFSKPHRWLYSSRFWKGMIKVFSNPGFDAQHWQRNLIKNMERMRICATAQGYETMILDMYNWHLREDRILM